MENFFNYSFLAAKLLVPFNVLKQGWGTFYRNITISEQDAWSYKNAESDSQMAILDKGTLLSVSDLKGNIIYANENFCRVSKYSIDELVGKPHNIVRHEDMSSSVFKDMWRTIGSGKVWQGELKNKAKDGSFYWVYTTISPVLGENGKPVKYISMRQDITEQKIAQQELEMLKSNRHDELYENVHYAKNVHSTFLPSEEMLHESFSESFLIYKAQKIISGDFYMVRNNGDNSVLVLGDSTGHGVSASYISVMVLNMLNRFLRLSAYCPAKILEDLHEEIILSMSANRSKPIIESADMGFCIVDHKKMVLEYALAKMRGVILRGKEVIELKRDKFSIGDNGYKEISLNNNKVKIMKGDILYLYTDGIIDQFGGQKNKKLTNKNLIEALKTFCSLPMGEQKTALCNYLNEWQGDNEQTDDITVMGVKIL